MKQSTGKIVTINGLKYILPDDQKSLEGLENVVYEFRGKMDSDITQKLFKLLNIFCDTDGSMPEEVEKYFGITNVEGVKERVEKVREKIMVDLGYSKKTYIKSFKLSNPDLDPEMVAHVESMLRGLNLIVEPVEAISLTTFTNPVKYQQFYQQVKDYIFNMLRENGWSEKNLEQSFGCLYFGMTLNEYNLTKK